MVKRLTVGLAGVAGASAAAVACSTRRKRRISLRSRIVIVGEGTAGIDVAARLCGSLADPDRAEASLIPRRATWIRERVAAFESEANALVLESGKRIGYDYLVVAAGHQLDYAKVDGVEGKVGRDGLYSNYTRDGATATWQGIRSFTGGTAVFVEPKGPIKRGGAPQKIAGGVLRDLLFRLPRGVSPGVRGSWSSDLIASARIRRRSR